MADHRKLNVIDEEDAEGQRARANMVGLPLSWANADGTVVGKNRMVQAPTLDQVRTFSCTRVRTCADCVHFQRGFFQQVKDRFMAALVHEHQWNPKFIGDRPERMGRCAQDPELVTGPNSLACDHYRVK